MIDSNFTFKENYVHLILQIQSKANDVVKIVWTLSGFNLDAIGSLWQPLGASVWALTQRYLIAGSSEKVAKSADVNTLERLREC